MTPIRPVNDSTPSISQGFSARHGGVDYAYPDGTPIYATEDGRVTIATNHYVNAWINTGTLTTRDYGNMIKLDHGGGYSSLYAHLKKDSLLVGIGDSVKKGQQIASVGSTGNSTGNHVHFEIRLNEKAVNPAPMLDTGFTGYFTVDKLGQQQAHSGQSVTLDGAKFTELVTKSTAYDELKPAYEALKAQFNENNSSKDSLIANLNQQVNDRNNDIARLNAERNSLSEQLTASEQARYSLEEIAKRVPTLEEELHHQTDQRRRYQEENERVIKANGELMKARDRAIADAPMAFWTYLLRRFGRQGGV